tara:strand:- start:4804 stop:4989 length:186 start_codon:yes stop_codon:yes gene_type:complete
MNVNDFFECFDIEAVVNYTYLNGVWKRFKKDLRAFEREPLPGFCQNLYGEHVRINFLNLKW